MDASSVGTSPHFPSAATEGNKRRHQEKGNQNELHSPPLLLLLFFFYSIYFFLNFWFLIFFFFTRLKVDVYVDSSEWVRATAANSIEFKLMKSGLEVADASVGGNERCFFPISHRIIWIKNEEWGGAGFRRRGISTKKNKKFKWEKRKIESEVEEVKCKMNHREKEAEEVEYICICIYIYIYKRENCVGTARGLPTKRKAQRSSDPQG